MADTGDGPWVLRALATLDGLAVRVVVVGAASKQVTALLPAGVTTVENPDHAAGMGSSLTAGLRALGTDVDAAVVMLVDLPDVPAAAVRRVAAAAAGAAETKRSGTAEMPATERSVTAETEAPGPSGTAEVPATERSVTAERAATQRSPRPDVARSVRGALIRATYHGRPGHPVLIGADHFRGVLRSAIADRGARDYLANHAVTDVECGDLAGGADVDEPPST